MRVGEMQGAAARLTPHAIIRWRGRLYPPGGLFMPDLILPEQLEHRIRELTPEKRLCLAVLADCVHRLRKAVRQPHSLKTGRIIQRELRWLSSRADRPYSFEAICAVLDLDSDAVRRALRVKW